ncbi:DUF3152 domain-containing protein [Nocardioides bruguierae]|uniref:DUF3152 domain-containing protein n=1 Tax=Nocardioides bruguierae TaxID=2945102 RepID=UPI0020214323|nr:DUF3152 domain-containing protein [Nocardioides bruguierae]MCL8025601.1 DUF3152 domain-containing protein [Nocardioides bruguierae]
MGGLLLAPPATAAEGDVLTATERPTISGEPRFREPLVAGRGGWGRSPSEVSVAYQWLRAGEQIPGATGKRYRPSLEDLGNRLSVVVTATATDGASGTATSRRTTRVRRAENRATRAPRVAGTTRYGRVLRAGQGRWEHRPARVRITWYRAGGVEVGSGRRYRLQPADVGATLFVVARATGPGLVPATKRSERTPRVRHRVGVSRSVTYHVETRGDVSASVRRFKRLAQQTYDDARGWRSAGVRFTRVRSGGDFTLVLAEASTLTDFSSECSTQWSCRVGRYVVINQTRWRHASPAWNEADGSLRDYRHMVVNHETGHWLGQGHSTCPGSGQPAPVMMQQSKDLGGCTFNPWPVAGEISRVAG